MVSRDEAIAAGWFGEQVRDEIRLRIGDIVAAARGSATMVRRTVEPLESSLVGHHGSLAQHRAAPFPCCWPQADPMRRASSSTCMPVPASVGRPPASAAAHGRTD